MDSTIVLLVLTAALLHATWNALVKSGGDPMLRLAMANAAGGLCVVPLLPLVGVPTPAAWPYLLASVLVHFLYSGFLVLSYRVGDLSFVYPVARGAAPPLVAVGALVFAGEALSPLGVLAVIVICGAILGMARGGGHRDGSRLPLPFALCTGAAIAGYTVLDGLGARASGDVLGYIVWIFLLDAVPLAVMAAVLRRGALISQLRRHWRAGVGSGVLSAGAYGLVIWAMTLTPMTYVSALRETSVILAALIGSQRFREPFGGRRVAAAGLVAIGVILLQLSGSG